MNNFVGKELLSLPIYRIGVDIDLTLVDTLWPWINWFNEKAKNAFDLSPLYWGPTGNKFQPISRQCYLDFKGDLAILMRERQIGINEILKFEPMSFWRQEDLYDDMSPLPGSMEFLTGLYRSLMATERFSDVQFVAISKCEPEHERSKRRFIEREFKDMFSGFVSTDEKHLVAIDCLLDDNPKYVQSCRDNSIFQIYVPQGNYEFFDKHNEFVDEMLSVSPVEGVNHFQQMIPNIDGITNMLVQHFSYVR